jgi:hypothetical protein
MSGIISGITTSAKNVMNDAITAQGFRDIIGTGINSVRSLVDPSAKSDNIWQPQTLCITGDCSSFDPIEESGPGVDMAVDTFNSLRNGDYYHAGENIGAGAVMLGMMFFPEGEGGEAGALRTGNGFKTLSRTEQFSIRGGVEKSFVRFGQEAETAEFLAKKAQEAENAGFPHGVSVMLKDKIQGSDLTHKSALKSTVEEFFEVKQTGNKPRHHTVILPKPVTSEVAQQFNKVFKPKTK